jgi:hypothetical protein
VDVVFLIQYSEQRDIDKQNRDFPVRSLLGLIWMRRSLKSCITVSDTDQIV